MAAAPPLRYAYGLFFQMVMARSQTHRFLIALLSNSDSDGSFVCSRAFQDVYHYLDPLYHSPHCDGSVHDENYKDSHFDCVLFVYTVHFYILESRFIRTCLSVPLQSIHPRR
ncbi:hypothetical protein BCR34DRAFT_212134 [Clohesyomyces aquaticus]|uniref:Uncharacterized protein n=1 Tax=Clohesyomyces aquaticus TaxID=1231657 RepID=A0A1Y1ZYB9_9PLEO|nr:hypothetical protein BCR34DRAFT_212134 [Clohesyomyces aquaticus]